MNAMNYNALILEELGLLANTDAGARQFIADYAERIILDTADEPFENLQACYDEGFRDGEQGKLDQLCESYSEELLKWMSRIADLSLAAEDDIDELGNLLAVIRAEFRNKSER